MCILRYFFVFFSILSFMGCQKSGPSSHKDKNSQYLQISLHGDVRSLDPRIGIDYPSAHATKMLFEGLMRTGKEGRIEPAIAESYEVSEDFLTYTFHLRPTQWSNGDEVTAYDFEYSWKKVIDPKSAYNLGVQNFYPIKNAKAIVKGEMPTESVGIKAVDEKTFTVELAHPTPYFLEATATSSYYPINARIDRENPQWPNQNYENFVCNGPFVLEYRRLENEIVLKKNRSYWDADSVHLPGIRIAIIKDASTQLNLFEKNELAWLGKPLSTIPLDAINHLRSQGKLKLIDTLGLYWFFLNTESFPFQNKKIRKAFSYAINRRLLIDHVLLGEETPACGVLPYQLATQDTPFFKDNDQEGALKLFHEALNELEITKDELPEITINCTTSAESRRFATALQEQWSQIFGVNIKIEQQEWKSHYEKLQKGNFQIGGMNWQSWLHDPMYIMQTFREKANELNMSRWTSEEYTQWLNLAEKEVDLQKRKSFFNQAESILMDEMPIIPVYFTTSAYAQSDQLKNVYVSDLFEVDFRWASLKE